MYAVFFAVEGGLLSIALGTLLISWIARKVRRSRQLNRAKWWSLPAQPGEISVETERCIEFASTYWASHLTIPTIKEADSEARSLFLTDLALSIQPPTSQQVRLFRQLLGQKTRKSIQAQFEEDEPLAREQVERWSFHVDYLPEGILYEAAEEAGIGQSLLRFPAKTHLEIVRGEVYLQPGPHLRKHRIYP